MTSFGWKKKVEKRKHSRIFDDDDVSDDSDHSKFEEIDWTEGIKRKKMLLLEDCNVKSERLVQEGIKIAEHGRYWEAIKKWKEAVELTPHCSKIYEMMAQAFLELGEIFPAVQEAEKSAKLDRNWWVAFQTLGRAQLAIGEIKMAVVSFCKALHLNPDSSELRNEDLKWAISLLDKTKNSLQTMQQSDNSDFEQNDLIKARDSSSN